MDGCKPAWRFCALKSSGEVEIQGIIKNIEKETKGRKGNSSPFLEPEPLTRNGCLSVFVFPAEMCTITVTKQNLPLHNRPAQTLSLRPRACCCACQTRTHQRVEGSKIDWVILADVSSAISPRRPRGQRAHLFFKCSVKCHRDRKTCHSGQSN